MRHEELVPSEQAASVLLRGETGRVLLVRHGYGQRRYSLPGGVIEPGETPEQAGVREAREEIGVEVELEGHFGFHLVHGLNRPNVPAHVFRARIRSGVVRIADEQEIAELVWVNAAAPPAPLTNNARTALSDYASGRSGGQRRVERRS